LSAPLLLAPIAMVWAGFRVVQMGSDVLGIGLIVVAAITAVLAFRHIRHLPAAQLVDPVTGDVPRAYFDYIVWAFIGLPFILLGLLVLSLITNDATGT
jgi:hypothetical protein